MGKKQQALGASSQAQDPSLVALFASSSGPVAAALKAKYTAPAPSSRRQEAPSPEDASESDDAEQSEGDEEDGQSNISSSDSDDVAQAGSTSEEQDLSSETDAAEIATQLGNELVNNAKSAEKKRKRKRNDDDEGLEGRYFQKLAEDDAPKEKRRRSASGAEADGAGEATGRAPGSTPDDDDDVPVHESLASGKAVSELEKASRTVFLSNVSVDAVTSSKAKKALLAHLSSVLDTEATPKQSIESLRFRSLAFGTAAMPKRAAYITKNVMDATTKSANAYVVYSTPALARAAVSSLNGTTVLDRHLRVDSVAHPSHVAHRRCVFIGNLGFVDDETVINTKVDADGKEVTEKRKRTKVPMDVEEGLWRVFGKEAGKVESVRVVRDPVTRVGKGFAYVQFYVSELEGGGDSRMHTDSKRVAQDENSVEAALVLSGKKYPPMLPRELRVSRCKAPHKTARAQAERLEKAKAEGRQIAGGKSKSAGGQRSGYTRKPTAEETTLAGRAGKVLGKAAAADMSGKHRKVKQARHDKVEGGQPESFKSPEDIVFEGVRASAKNGKPKELRFKVKGGGRKRPSGATKKPWQEGRGAKRAAQWKEKKTS